MPADFAELSGVLYCPDDGCLLSCQTRRIDCPAGGRNFPILGNGIAELLPRRPVPVPSDRDTAYWRAYREAYREEFREASNAIAWGAAEVAPVRWVQRRLRQTRAVEPLVGDSRSSRQLILCDIAAGAGYYTLAYSSKFRVVLHCDISMNNLNYVAQRTQALGLTNLFLLRTDYFAMPFRESVDRILCVDTLIRGEDHELALLRSIRSALAPKGRAIVDFHNWWHNPVRRLGLLPENFHENRSYRAKETRRLMAEAGITRFDCYRFYQEFEPDSRYRALLSRIVPATRLLFRFEGEQLCEC